MSTLINGFLIVHCVGSARPYTRSFCRAPLCANRLKLMSCLIWFASPFPGEESVLGHLKIGHLTRFTQRSWIPIPQENPLNRRTKFEKMRKPLRHNNNKKSQANSGLKFFCASVYAPLFLFTWTTNTIFHYEMWNLRVVQSGQKNIWQ